MKVFTQHGRAVLLVAVLAVGSVWLFGCVGDDNPSNSGGNNTGGGGGGSYDYVTIGGLKWMKKNLNVSTADSWCGDNDNSNCNKYGRLYTWEAAKKACQSIGWRLPTRADWDNLAAAVGGRKDYTSDSDIYHDWFDAGRALKSTSGWNNNGNGTDSYGFSALPGGGRDYYDGSFNNAGYVGYWWTATEYGSDNAYGRYMNYRYDFVNEYFIVKGHGFSARCVQD